MNANFLDHIKVFEDGRIPGMTTYPPDEVLLTVLVGLLRRMEEFDEIAMFGEDQSRLRKGHGARNMAVVRHFAVNLVRTAPEPERRPPMKPQRKAAKPKHTSIKLRRKIASWRSDYLALALEASAR